MSLEKLAQSSHVHLLGFAVLFGFTGLLFALTSYPAPLRFVLAPLVLLAQVADIACWWLARIDGSQGEMFARIIPITGSLVLLYMFLPIFVVIVFSFNLPNGKFNYQWVQFSTQAWTNLCAPGGMCEALRLSLVISLITVVLAYPVAVYLASLAPRQQALMLLVYALTRATTDGWTSTTTLSGRTATTLPELNEIWAPARVSVCTTSPTCS